MQINYTSNSTKDTEDIGKELAEILVNSNITRSFIALFGEMGVGKTAFTRGFCSAFGITSVKSPTYTVLNEYKGSSPVHHFDFYRITDEEDLYSIGYDDILFSDGYCIGEWSENIQEMLPENYVSVKISKTDFSSDAEGKRTIEIIIPEL